MTWYLQLVFYICGMMISFVSMWWVDFNKFIRVHKKQYAIFLYVILSLVLGFLLGKMFVEFGVLIPKI